MRKTPFFYKLLTIFAIFDAELQRFQKLSTTKKYELVGHIGNNSPRRHSGILWIHNYESSSSCIHNKY